MVSNCAMVSYFLNDVKTIIFLLIHLMLEHLYSTIHLQWDIKNVARNKWAVKWCVKGMKEGDIARGRDNEEMISQIQIPSQVFLWTPTYSHSPVQKHWWFCSSCIFSAVLWWVHGRKKHQLQNRWSVSTAGQQQNFGIPHRRMTVGQFLW